MTWRPFDDVFREIVENQLEELDRYDPGPATMPRGRNGKRKLLPPSRDPNHMTRSERELYESGWWLGDVEAG